MADGSGVDYSLNIGCEEGYARNGFPVEAGRLRAKVGCNWTVLPGTEYPLQNVTRCNMAQAFLKAIEQALYGWKAPSGNEVLVYREQYWYNSGGYTASCNRAY